MVQQCETGRTLPLCFSWENQLLKTFLSHNSCPKAEAEIATFFRKISQQCSQRSGRAVTNQEKEFPSSRRNALSVEMLISCDSNSTINEKIFTKFLQCPLLLSVKNALTTCAGHSLKILKNFSKFQTATLRYSLDKVIFEVKLIIFTEEPQQNQHFIILQALYLKPKPIFV